MDSAHADLWLPTRRRFLAGGSLAACGWFTSAWGRVEANATSPWDLPVSPHFGLTADRRPKDPRSRYRAGEPGKGNFTIDLSNNFFGCCLNAEGDVLRGVMQMAILPVDTSLTPVGAYVDRLLERGGAAALSVELEGPEGALPVEWLGLDLAAGRYPIVRRRKGPLLLETFSFVPETGDDAIPLAALMTLVRVSASAPIRGTLRVSFAAGTQCCFAETGGPDATFSLKGGESAGRRMLYALSQRDRSEGPDGPNAFQAAVRQSVSQSFQQTERAMQSRFGSLTIDGGSFYAELYTRAAELSRQAITLTPNGGFGGSFIGSDEPVPSTVWMKDCYYAALAQCLHAPRLSELAIPFFFRWGLPAHALGDPARHGGALNAVSNSLGNSVSALVLAEFHFRQTGDAALFRRHPEWLVEAERVLESILESRRFEPYLFPSLYVSDGDARGDFHTGSNLLVWRAFSGMARLAREVYDRPDLADTWQEIARRIRASWMDFCVIHGSNGDSLAEGAMADHAVIALHDGEESDTTLMPFYGFCEPDDPLYTNTARAAMSAANPYFAAPVEGIWWYAHGRWSSATFPGWVTALASAENEDQMLARLETIRGLTDADGSFWWWPYKHDTFSAGQPPERTPGKSAWAAAVYQCVFLRNLLGITHDAARKTLAVRPFCPWPSFRWERCRLGTSCFDLDYRRAQGEISLAVKNRNGSPFQVAYEILLPVAANVGRCTLDGKPVAVEQRVSRGRTLVCASISLNADQTARFQVEL